MSKDLLCLVDDRVHDLADVLQVGDERLLVDGVLLQPGQDVLQPESGRREVFCNLSLSLFGLHVYFFPFPHPYSTPLPPPT